MNAVTSPVPRPVPLRVQFENVPTELRNTASWVMWRYELTDKGKWTKPPKTVKGKAADTTKPATWTTFDQARAAYEQGDFDGVGFVLTNGIAGVDPDHAVDPDDGSIVPWAAEILERFKGTYRERSPSGEGFRVFAHGKPARCGKGTVNKHIEVYAKGSPRYLTVTGHALDDVREIAPMQPAFDWLHAEHMEKAPPAPAAPAAAVGSGSLTDAEVLELARNAKNGAKFSRLWSGDAGGHGNDASAADAALVTILAYWTGKDHAQIDRLFRRSGLMRDKWDSARGESTYGENTIAEMIARTAETFTPRPALTAQDHANAEAIVLSGRAKRATSDDCDRQEWQEPQPLPDALAPVAAFDSALLPVSLRAWCDDISERVQCPPDFVAVAAVAAMGAVLGRKIAVRPQRQTPWSEVANQWAMAIGRPGVMKSPAIEQALGPLRRLEATAREKHAIESTAFQADEAARKLRAKANEHDAAKAIAKNRRADVSELLRDTGDYAEIPVCKRYSTSDTSVQSLAELVRLNPNGLLVHRDEMVSLLRDLDREEKAGDRGFYLTAWNGSTSYTVDRIGRGLDLHIPAVCLSLLGGTQPARLASYVHAAMHGGSGDDGLIQRFGLMVWPDLAGEWRNVDRWPDTKAKREAFDAFGRLDDLIPGSVGAEQDTDFNGDPEGAPFLRLDDVALGEFVEWRVELERRLRSGELSPALESHLAKYRKLVPSLALLFHVADGHDGAIGRDSLLRALAWAEYLESHARRVYGSGPASEATTARAILARIRKGDLPAVFAGWEVWRPGWAGLADRSGVSDGLALLVDFGYLAVGRIKTPGREATRYTVNPRALQ